jgi:hypothetical protein
MTKKSHLLYLLSNGLKEVHAPDPDRIRKQLPSGFAKGIDMLLSYAHPNISDANRLTIYSYSTHVVKDILERYELLKRVQNKPNWNYLVVSKNNDPSPFLSKWVDYLSHKKKLHIFDFSKESTTYNNFIYGIEQDLGLSLDISEKNIKRLKKANIQKPRTEVRETRQEEKIDIDEITEDNAIDTLF